MSATPVILSRRRVLAGSGALILSFASLPSAVAQEGGSPANNAGPPLPGDLNKSPFLDSWIRIDASGAITVSTGKLSLKDGGLITAQTQGPGKGGSVMVKAFESIDIAGEDSQANDSAIVADTNGEMAGAGDAGALTVSTGTLAVAVSRLW